MSHLAAKQKEYEFTRAEPGHFASTTKTSFSKAPTTDWVAKSAPPKPNYQRDPIEFTKADPDHYVTTTKSSYDPVGTAPRAPLAANPSNHYVAPTDIHTAADNEHFETTSSRVASFTKSTPTPNGKEQPRRGDGTTPDASAIASPAPKYPYDSPASELTSSRKNSLSHQGSHRKLHYDPPTTTVDTPDHYATTSKTHHSPSHSAQSSPLSSKRSSFRNLPQGQGSSSPTFTKPTPDQYKTTNDDNYADKSVQGSQLNRSNSGVHRYSAEAVRTTAEADHYRTTHKQQFGWAAPAQA